MIFLIKNVTILSEYICTKVSQIGFDVTIEIVFATALAVFLLCNSHTTLRNGDFYEKI